jgi:ADP-ribose pyrophosphatase
VNPQDLAWERLSSETVLSHHGRGVDRTRFRLPDGQVADYYLKSEPDVVAVLALTGRDEVILTRQFRPGPGEILYELPGGYVDPAEDPATATGRELLEETGYAGRVEPAGRCFPDAYCTTVKHAFVATGCVRTAERAGTGDEFIRVELMGLPAFRALLREGRMTDVDASYLALDHLGLL